MRCAPWSGMSVCVRACMCELLHDAGIVPTGALQAAGPIYGQRSAVKIFSLFPSILLILCCVQNLMCESLCAEQRPISMA